MVSSITISIYVQWAAADLGTQQLNKAPYVIIQIYVGPPLD